MAAPIGNKFWELRSKHGRDKLFASPDLLWEAACEYFEWCSNNPWNKIEQVKMPGKAYADEYGIMTSPDKTVELPTPRPLTLTGLCLYIGCNSAYFRQFKQTGDKDFSTIITRIEETIETQQFEGAAVGAFNASIIARKLGLTDKTEAKVETTFTGLNIQVNKSGLPPATSEKDYLENTL